MPPPLKILCIEDDPETGALIAEEFAERGYEISLARDGQEGFAAILRLLPDLHALHLPDGVGRS